MSPGSPGEAVWLGNVSESLTVCLLTLKAVWKQRRCRDCLLLCDTMSLSVMCHMQLKWLSDSLTENLTATSATKSDCGSGWLSTNLKVSGLPLCLLALIYGICQVICGHWQAWINMQETSKTSGRLEMSHVDVSLGKILNPKLPLMLPHQSTNQSTGVVKSTGWADGLCRVTTNVWMGVKVIWEVKTEEPFYFPKSILNKNTEYSVVTSFDSELYLPDFLVLWVGPCSFSQTNSGVWHIHYTDLKILTLAQGIPLPNFWLWQKAWERIMCKWVSEKKPCQLWCEW